MDLKSILNTIDKHLGHESPLMAIQELMNKDAYIFEYAYWNEDIKKIKRDSEYQGWVTINEAALNFQKTFKSRLEKSYLLKFLENKYQDDMSAPTVTL